MISPRLTVLIGGKPRARLVRVNRRTFRRKPQGSGIAEQTESCDVIPLLDGWVRVLERQALALQVRSSRDASAEMSSLPSRPIPR